MAKKPLDSNDDAWSAGLSKWDRACIDMTVYTDIRALETATTCHARGLPIDDFVDVLLANRDRREAVLARGA